MKWITREKVKVDRVACPWLVKRFIDQQAEFGFVPAGQVAVQARQLRATPFDIEGCELGHRGADVSFNSILKKYKLTDPSLGLLGEIVRAADSHPIGQAALSRFGDPEIDDFRHRHAVIDGDQNISRLDVPVNDALLMGVLDDEPYVRRSLRAREDHSSAGPPMVNSPSPLVAKSSLIPLFSSNSSMSSFRSSIGQSDPPEAIL